VRFGGAVRALLLGRREAWRSCGVRSAVDSVSVVVDDDVDVVVDADVVDVDCIFLGNNGDKGAAGGSNRVWSDVLSPSTSYSPISLYTMLVCSIFLRSDFFLV